MSIKVVELLHTGVRIPNDEKEVDKAIGFYVDLLGMERDALRPNIPGIPGAWINVRAGARNQQLHIMCAEGQSPVARSDKEDPTRWHLAFAVADLEAAEATLKAEGRKYWVYESLVGRASRQIFLEDPFGNMIELQQHA